MSCKHKNVDYGQIYDGCLDCGAVRRVAEPGPTGPGPWHSCPKCSVTQPTEEVIEMSDTNESRVKSINAHRLKNNPLEQRFVDEWSRINTYYHTAEYVLSGTENNRQEVSEHDQEIAVTLVQWLGTPIGQAFLEEVLGIPDLRKQIQSKLESRRIQSELDKKYKKDKR